MRIVASSVLSLRAAQSFAYQSPGPDADPFLSRSILFDMGVIQRIPSIQPCRSEPSNGSDPHYWQGIPPSFPLARQDSPAGCRAFAFSRLRVRRHRPLCSSAWLIHRPKSNTNGRGCHHSKGAQDARVQERRVRAKISLSACSNTKYFQRPTPSHLSKNAPSLQGHGDADVARSRRRGVSLTCQQICYVLYLVM